MLASLRNLSFSCATRSASYRSLVDRECDAICDQLEEAHVGVVELRECLRADMDDADHTVVGDEGSRPAS